MNGERECRPRTGRPTTLLCEDMPKPSSVSKAQQQQCNDVNALLTLTTCSARLPASLLQPELWQSMARGGLTVGEKAASAAASASHADLSGLRHDLEHAGLARHQTLDWDAHGVPLTALSETIEALREHGYPGI